MQTQFAKLFDNKGLIARIYFSKQRNGNGHDLLKFLIENSQQYNYTKIGIEYANENAAGFALRYGFTNHRDKDWIVEIEKLKEYFE